MSVPNRIPPMKKNIPANKSSLTLKEQLQPIAPPIVIEDTAVEDTESNVKQTERHGRIFAEVDTGHTESDDVNENSILESDETIRRIAASMCRPKDTESAPMNAQTQRQKSLLSCVTRLDSALTLLNYEVQGQDARMLIRMAMKVVEDIENFAHQM